MLFFQVALVITLFRLKYRLVYKKRGANLKGSLVESNVFLNGIFLFARPLTLPPRHFPHRINPADRNAAIHSRANGFRGEWKIRGFTMRAHHHRRSAISFEPARGSKV